MIVAIGCDHAGFALKPRIVHEVEALGHEVLDCGAFVEEPGDDYPDFARAVGLAITEKRAERGVLFCGSGVGVSVAANKLVGIRACLCHDTYSAHQGVEHDGMNVLCVGARVVGPELVGELVRSFLRAEFSNEERHARRLAKVLALEAHPPTGPWRAKSSYVLAVPDLVRSGEYYAKVLGFTVRDLAPGWKVFEREPARIMAGECPDALPAGKLGDHSYFAYIEIEGLDAYFATVEKAGARIRKPLRDEPWGMREFAVETIDGHRIMFGAPVRRG